ncbi:MAG: DUF2341 domain-containing protein, partial [Candidatus Paceibacterota bacterium]
MWLSGKFIKIFLISFCVVSFFITDQAKAIATNGSCGPWVEAKYNDSEFALLNPGSLCSGGTYTTPTRPFSTDGSWYWSCIGSGGGSTASCCTNSYSNPTCLCGSAEGIPTSVAPSSGTRCSNGGVQNLSGSYSTDPTLWNGSWYWVCAGTQGNYFCTAPNITAVNGTCGTANTHSYSATTDINTDAMKCSAGTFTSFTDNGSSWSWGCNGSGGGTNATCSANKVSCGSYHNTIRKDQPSTNLCQYGTNTTLTLTNNTWFYTCTNNPGTDVACYTYKTSCGSSNDGSFSSAPTTNLCAANGGTPSEVTGSGPWNWTCAGDDSQTVSCSANIGASGDGACNVASGTINLNTQSCSGRGTADAINFITTANNSAGATTITLSTAPTGLAVGDQVLVINMQGTSDDYINVGKYEAKVISQINGNTLTFTQPLINNYNGASQKIMVQRLPNYTNVTIAAGAALTVDSWNGSKNGVMAFNASGTVTVSGTIDLNGKGFSGGAGCPTSGFFGMQGYSYAGIPAYSGGPNFSGAGGGRYDAGGAGGGYMTAGSAGIIPAKGGGPAGLAGSAYSNPTLTKLLLGSGGSGGGGTGDSCPRPGGAGGAGGGIIFISANTVNVPSGGIIRSNANTGATGGTNGGCRQGAGGGGGGAGGSLKIISPTRTLTGTVSVLAGGGGAGGSQTYPGGAGGAGSVGIIYQAANACGSDDGATIPQTPTNLCNDGLASAVSGVGPWTWTCTASNALVSNCSASKTGNSWLSGWSYRKPITVINNSGSTLTDYQIKLTIVYDSKMQTDFRDLKFTDGTGTANLNYWIESKTDSATAVVWVKVASIPISGTTIYMYYGNSAATSASDGTLTFDFFDDFNGASIDAGKWTVTLNGGGTVSVSDGMASITTGGAGQYPTMACNTDVAANNMIWEIKAKRSAGTTAAHLISLVQSSAYNVGVAVASDYNGNFGQIGLLNHGVAWASTKMADYNTSNTYFILSAAYDGTNLIGWYNRGVKTSWAQSSYANKHATIVAWYASGAGTYNIDWAIQRKYIAIEPTSLLRDEESVNVTPVISTVIPSPSTVGVGNSIIFNTNWTDASDQAKLHICKTNSIGSGMGTSTVFTYTGADQTYTVPAGVTSISVKAWGGGGGGGNPGGWTFGYPGGGGGYTQGVISVSPGQTLTVIVGAGGNNGSISNANFSYGGGGKNCTTGTDCQYGGQGGGRSAIRNGSTELLTAGGGGGGGSRYSTSINAAGGAGGGAIGQTGVGGENSTYGGGGGTQSAGGAGGAATNVGVAGSQYQGGYPSSNSYGGGGGGGWYGGGGGSYLNYSMGG